jgi:DNA modification methylase
MTIQLLHGDCLVRMAEIPDGSVDMILADLPYGTTACKWDNVIPFEPLWKHYWRVLKPNGAVVLFGSEPFSSHLRMSQIKYYKYDWVWEKDRPSNFATAKYHTNEISRKYFSILKGKTTY